MCRKCRCRCGAEYRYVRTPRWQVAVPADDVDAGTVERPRIQRQRKTRYLYSLFQGLTNAFTATSYPPQQNEIRCSSEISFIT